MNRDSATFQLVTGLTGPSFTRDGLNNATFTWLNFDMRTALGTLWEKYDRLIMYCTQIVYFTNTSANNDRTLNFYVSGIPLEYKTYNNNTNTVTDEALLHTIFQGFQSTNVVKNYPSNSGIVFRKGEQFVNLRIQVKSGLTQNTAVNVSFAAANFVFQIMVYGIEEVPRLIRNVNPRTYPLVLSGSQASTINSTKTRMEFANIDLRALIGPDYDKHDRFKMLLTSYVMNNQTNGSTAAISILVDGLAFQNGTYTIAYGVSGGNLSTLGMRQTSYWTAASVWYVTGTTIPIFCQDYTGCVFGKYQDTVRLTLSLVYMGGTQLRPEQYANSTFYFHIVPIEE